MKAVLRGASSVRVFKFISLTTKIGFVFKWLQLFIRKSHVSKLVFDLCHSFSILQFSCWVPHRPTSAMTGRYQSVPACTAVSPRSRWKVARRRLAAWIITDGRTASGSSGAWSQAGPRETETDRPTDLLARRSVVGPSEHTVGRNLALTQCCLLRQRSQVVSLALW